MKGRLLIVVGVISLAAAVGVAGAWFVLGGSASDNSRPVSRSGAGDIEVTDVWVSVSLDVAAGYAAFENPGADDRLRAVATPVAGTVSLMDETTHGGGHDGHDLDGFPVPSGTSELSPGVAHIMLEDLSVTIEPGDRVELEVEDRGRGIPEASRNAIFNLFYQAEGATTRSAGGLGDDLLNLHHSQADTEIHLFGGPHGDPDSPDAGRNIINIFSTHGPTFVQGGGGDDAIRLLRPGEVGGHLRDTV
jgi:copper(I)-binding protein